MSRGKRTKIYLYRLIKQTQFYAWEENSEFFIEKKKRKCLNN